MLVVGQLGALAHEANTRDVECVEHGEELEAAQLVEQLHACDQDHLVGVEGNAGDHEDCAIARALHQSTQTSRFVTTPQLAPLVSERATFVQLDIQLVTALYLIAPKTSPPLAA
jgi:hypothetical protein